jgi:hypothetical protein
VGWTGFKPIRDCSLSGSLRSESAVLPWLLLPVLDISGPIQAESPLRQYDVRATACSGSLVRADCAHLREWLLRECAHLREWLLRKCAHLREWLPGANCAHLRECLHSSKTLNTSNLDLGSLGGISQGDH